MNSLLNGSRKATVIAIAAAVACTAISAELRADLAPPKAYSKTCTLADQKDAAESCQLCKADYQDPDACRRGLVTQGLTRRCRGPGAVAWEEVWCRAPSTPSPSVSSAQPPAPSAPPLSVSAASASPSNAPKATSGCRASTGAACSPSMVWIAAALVWLVRRRRAQASWSVSRHTPKDMQHER
jgi:hypothetical protein